MFIAANPHPIPAPSGAECVRPHGAPTERTNRGGIKCYKHGAPNGALGGQVESQFNFECHLSSIRAAACRIVLADG